jgi:hypothetical protein
LRVGDGSAAGVLRAEEGFGDVLVPVVEGLERLSAKL